MASEIYADIAQRTNGDIYIGTYRKIHVYQTLYGAAGHPQHSQRSQTGTGSG